LSCVAFRGRGAGAPGSGFASGRLLHKVAGTQLAPNSSRPRPSMLSLAVQRWPMRKSQHARPPIIAASPIVFQLGTSPFSRPPKPSGGVAAVHGRRRVGRNLRRRPEIPLDPPRGLVNEARPARLLPIAAATASKNADLCAGSIGWANASSRVISSSEKSSGMVSSSGWGRAIDDARPAANSRGRRRLRERNSLAATAFGVLARRPGAVRIRAHGVGMSHTKAWQGVAGARSYRETTLRPFPQSTRKVNIRRFSRTQGTVYRPFVRAPSLQNLNRFSSACGRFRQVPVALQSGRQTPRSLTRTR
jgi:hypothetical protein